MIHWCTYVSRVPLFWYNTRVRICSWHDRTGEAGGLWPCMEPLALDIAGVKTTHTNNFPNKDYFCLTSRLIMSKTHGKNNCSVRPNRLVRVLFGDGKIWDLPIQLRF